MVDGPSLNFRESWWRRSSLLRGHSPSPGFKQHARQSSIFTVHGPTWVHAKKTFLRGTLKGHKSTKPSCLGSECSFLFYGQDVFQHLCSIRSCLVPRSPKSQVPRRLRASRKSQAAQAQPAGAAAGCGGGEARRASRKTWRAGSLQSNVAGFGDRWMM